MMTQRILSAQGKSVIQHANKLAQALALARIALKLRAPLVANAQQ